MFQTRSNRILNYNTKKVVDFNGQPKGFVEQKQWPVYPRKKPLIPRSPENLFQLPQQSLVTSKSTGNWRNKSSRGPPANRIKSSSKGICIARPVDSAFTSLELPEVDF